MNYCYKNKYGFLIYLLLYLIICSSIQWVSIVFGYKRYLFNFELSLAFIFIFFGYKIIGGLFYIFSIIQEIALGMSSVFNFSNYSQITSIAEFLPEANIKVIIASIFVCISIALFYFILLKIKTDKKFWKVFHLMMILFSIQFYICFLAGNFKYPTLLNRSELIFGSAFIFNENIQEINKNVYKIVSEDGVEYNKLVTPTAASISLLNKDDEKIVFIMAESWGKSINTEITQAQLAPLKGGANLKDMMERSINASGSTVFAEFRELCGKIPSKLKFKYLDKDNMKDCLPNIYLDKGYKTISLHGAIGSMYDRLVWYPAIGFSEMKFKDDFPYSSERICFSFPGYCDRFIFDEVEKNIKNNDRVFLYWMTLNSHTPFDQRDIVNYRKELCDKLFIEKYEDQLCKYHNLHLQFFEKLAELIKKESMKGVRFIIVGDHAPIFNDESSRVLFDKKNVPMISFTVQ